MSIPSPKCWNVPHLFTKFNSTLHIVAITIIWNLLTDPDWCITVRWSYFQMYNVYKLDKNSTHLDETARIFVASTCTCYRSDSHAIHLWIASLSSCCNETFQLFRLDAYNFCPTCRHCRFNSDVNCIGINCNLMQRKLDLLRLDAY